MTEDEAKTKWCPFARLRSDENDCTGYNRTASRMLNGDLDFKVSGCIASACMAWRWRGYYAEDGKFVKRVVEGHYDEARAEGHCGLAGQP